MTEGEVVALFLAERLMEQYRGTPYENDLRSLFQKVTRWLPEPIAVDVAGLAGSLSVVPAAVTPHDLKRFQLLAAAALHGRQLEIEYWTASRNATGRRRVDPYRLMLADGNWYLVGYCHRRQEVLTFAVVRVRQASETGDTFARPDHFDLAAYLKGSFRVWRGRSNYAVTLRFRASVAGRVAEKHWPASQALEPQADGSLIVRFQVTDLREVQGWVLSWGSDCEVLEPPEFRTAMAAELERMLGQYGG